MHAIQYVRSVPRYLLNRCLGPWFPSVHTGPFSLFRRVEIDPPRLPGRAWARIRPRQAGICGSDLATLTAKGSAYFSPLISTPFVLGHEVVGTVVETGGDVTRCAVGDRVVMEPALGCEVRGIRDRCAPCVAGRYAHCERVTEGDISAGIQTGYCRDTGGAWGEELVAHDSQIFRVPAELTDDEAVLIEPLSCALHAAGQGLPRAGETVLVIGSGSMGLLVMASLRVLARDFRIVAVARYPRQQELARSFGADEVVASTRQIHGRSQALLGTRLFKPEIGNETGIGGADVTFDCVGSSSSIDDALRFTRAGGRVVLAGMPGIPRNIDWTAIWYKGLAVQGAYAYGWEEVAGERVRTFDLALRLVREKRVDVASLAGAHFPFPKYRDAVRFALHGGRSGAAKTILVLEKLDG